MKSKHGFETTPARSQLMRQIRGKDTKPEITLRRALWAKGIRYRVNVSKLPGKPDVVIRKHKIVIFIDGEFWHGYKWARKKQRIAANREYWVNKIEGNIARDKKNTRELNKLGFEVIRFWQHEITRDLDKCVSRIVRTIS